MTATLLIIVTGAPCSGKTTLARRIAKEFHLPLVTKDDIKESLFDSLGWKDRDWSKQLGRATYPLLFYFVEMQLASGRSLIVESNFEPTFATEKFRALKIKFCFEPFQILCRAKPEILVQRFKARSESGARHRGHVDHLGYAEFEKTDLVSKHAAMNLGGQLFEIDSSDFNLIDYSELFNALRSAMKRIDEPRE